MEEREGSKKGERGSEGSEEGIGREMERREEEGGSDEGIERKSGRREGKQKE